MATTAATSKLDLAASLAEQLKQRKGERMAQGQSKAVTPVAELPGPL